MQPTAGPNELGYANTALITALFDTLAAKGILSASDLDGIVKAAIATLEPFRSISSVEGAINVINASVVPEINKHRPA